LEIKRRKKSPSCPRNELLPKHTNTSTKTTKINNQNNTNSYFEIKTPNGHLMERIKWKEKELTTSKK